MNDSYPKVKFFFRWYDFWVGFYYKRDTRWLYFLPIPMFGMVFDFGPKSDAPPWTNKSVSELLKTLTQADVDERLRAMKLAEKQLAASRDNIRVIGFAVPRRTFFVGKGEKEVTFLEGQVYALVYGPEAYETGDKPDARITVYHSPSTGLYQLPIEFFYVNKMEHWTEEPAAKETEE